MGEGVVEVLRELGKVLSRLETLYVSAHSPERNCSVHYQGIGAVN
ncbi:MAG: hypothetical protein QXT79_10280 [Thermofilaceae archaeon]